LRPRASDRAFVDTWTRRKAARRGTMGNCCSALVRAIKAQDLDSLLAYSTIKLVKIRDRYLGGLHYTLQLIIFLYVVVFEVFINAGYLEVEAPRGVTRASLRRPSSLTPLSEIPYCADATNATSTTTAVKNEWRRQCVYWDRHEVVYPPVRAGSFFITTRSSEMRFKRKDDAACADAGGADALGPTTPACAFEEIDYGDNERDYDVYTADVENFTLLVAHAVYGRTTGVTASGVCMDGYMPYPDGLPPATLPGQAGAQMQQQFSRYIKRWPRSSNTDVCPDAGYDEGKYNDGSWTDRGNLPGDVFTLQQLLAAGGISSLDILSDVDGSIESVRFEGMVLAVFLDYANRLSNVDQLKYRYRVQRIEKIDVKSEQTVYLNYPNEYVVRNRHGLLLIFIQTGSIGRFSFKALLLSVVGGLVLLKLSTTIVDLLALNCMTYRSAYYKHKYELTTDFSDVRDVRAATGADALAAAKLAEEKAADEDAEAANEY